MQGSSLIASFMMICLKTTNHHNQNFSCQDEVNVFNSMTCKGFFPASVIRNSIPEFFIIQRGFCVVLQNIEQIYLGPLLDSQKQVKTSAVGFRKEFKSEIISSDEIILGLGNGNYAEIFCTVSGAGKLNQFFSLLRKIL